MSIWSKALDSSCVAGSYWWKLVVSKSEAILSKFAFGMRKHFTTGSYKQFTPRCRNLIPLMVEQLEDRLTPADSGGAAPLLATLVYHYGPLIPNVQIQMIFLQDSQTKQESPYQSQLDGFFKAITTDSYIPTLLSPYSINGYTLSTGSVGKDDVNVSVTPFAQNDGIRYINDAQIRSVITQEIVKGNTAAPNRNTLYFVFAPPGDAVVDGSLNSTQGTAGYHSNFAEANGSQVYYAVMPDPGPPNNNIAFPKTAFQQLTMSSSHEMAEAITDPASNGWRTNDPGMTDGGEIGDLVGGQSYTQDGYVVHYMWSNEHRGPISALGASSNLVIDKLIPPTVTNFSGPVAYFTDTDLGLNASDFVAYVDFDDGNSRQFGLPHEW